jgi:DNA invertase Pin-like site-specific DNA recombinase
MDNNQFVGGYIRIDNYENLDIQKSYIDNFVSNKGYNVKDYFVDEVDISTPLHKRKGYSKLNDAIVSGKVNTVVISDMDRFTDDAGEKQGLLHNFAEKGIEIYVASTGEHINPSEPITKEQRLLAEAMRDMEEAKAKKKIK